MSGPGLTQLLVIPLLMPRGVGGGLLITPMLNTVLPGSPRRPRDNAFAMSSLTTFAIAVLAAVLVFLLSKRARAGDGR